MAKATTEKFSELVLQVEDPANTGSYINICGLVDVEIQRTAQVDQAEVPDCTDETLPLSVEKEVRSIDVTISATGVWAQESWDLVNSWFYSQATKEIRLQNANAAVGDTEYEAGPALLTELTSGRTKGKKVSASMKIEFDGTPTRTPKASS